MLIIKAIMQLAKLEKREGRMKAYVEASEISLMEKAATNLRDRLLIRLLFHLGCRISEVLALAVENIDFNHGTITIQHLKASLKLSCTGCGQRLGRSHMFCPKCGSKIEKVQAEQQERHRQRMMPVEQTCQSWSTLKLEESTM